jgi:hypothetical protein
MNTTSKNITKFDLATRLYISRAIEEIVDDPDRGLELSARTKKILLARSRSKGKLIPLSEVKKRLGIK